MNLHHKLHINQRRSISTSLVTAHKALVMTRSQVMFWFTERNKEKKVRCYIRMLNESHGLEWPQNRVGEKKGMSVHCKISSVYIASNLQVV